jgi:excinuclease UvrABC helicase subunit UvrB
MIENKWTKEKQREWLKQHVLTPEQVNRRIQEKLERGFLIAQAIKQRENRLQSR